MHIFVYERYKMISLIRFDRIRLNAIPVVRVNHIGVISCYDRVNISYYVCAGRVTDNKPVPNSG